MIAEFYNNEAELKALFEQVKVWETRSWITPANAKRLSSYVPPLSEAQAEEIQTQMADLSVYAMIAEPKLGYERNAFGLYMKTEPYHRDEAVFNPFGHGKGYAYLEKPLPSASCVFDKNLNRIDDSADARKKCSGLIYWPIEDNWYLFLQGSESS